MTCEGCSGCKLALCKKGEYGTICNQTCSPNCRALPCSMCICEVCHKTTGNCTNGCDTGWYGAKCDYVCPENCDLTTELYDVCERETGDCLNGCRNGFYGNKCNTTCNSRCTDLLCDKENGTCVKGCIDDYAGEICGVPVSGGLGRDEVAGAIGGAFVITLWAAVVIVLICVLWRKRLKRLEIFHRNTSFGNQPTRSSSRRHLRRNSSNSSLDGSANHSLADELLHRGENTGSEPLYYHRPLHEKRSVTFKTDNPEFCLCNQSEAGEFYVCRGIRTEEHEYERGLQNHLHEFHVHFTNDHDATTPIRRASSEGDLSELSAVWKPSIY